MADHGHLRCAIERHGLRRSRPRIAFVTIGQAPRADVVPNILGVLDGAVNYQEFGALDGLMPAEIASQTRRGSEKRLYTRVERLTVLLQRLDDLGFNLIVLITTGVYQVILIVYSNGAWSARGGCVD
jgi:hypothetical protein